MAKYFPLMDKLFTQEDFTKISNLSTNFDQNIEILENLQNQFVEPEVIFNNITKLNSYLCKANKEYILCLNIRSLNANFTSLQLFIESLDVRPSIIVCTETWNIEFLPFFELSGYKMYYNESRINQNDGVVIYIKDYITETTKIIEIGNLKILHSIITMDNNIKLEFSSLYRCHDLSKHKFISDINTFLATKINTKNHILLGDFNIDLIELDNLSNEFLNNFLEKGYSPNFQTITRPSFLNPNQGSCIDNIFSKIKSFLTKAIKLETLFNDHFPLFLEFKKPIKTLTKKDITPTINYVILRKEANKINWNSILTMHDPNSAIKELIKLTEFCVQKSKKLKKKQKKTAPRHPWITKELILMCKKKEILYNKWKRNVSNLNFKNEYKAFEKELEKIKKTAKYNFEHKEIEKNAGDSRRLWEIINEKIGKHKNKKQFIKYILDEESNLKIEDPFKISNTMNHYFSNIGENLSSKINKPLHKKLTLPPINEKTIFLHFTNKNEVLEIIKKIKKKKGVLMV